MQQLNTFIQLDKNIVRSANFTFKIGDTILTRSVNLHILLRLIIFHIIFVNIPFLFYLADIDKYKVFFNNVTNKVI